MVAFIRDDLSFILTQIKMAEAGQPPLNALLSTGLRTVDGVDNSVVPGQATFGSASQVFPHITDPLLQNAQQGTSYSATSGLVIDAQPRTISNLISDQTANNPAAIAAQKRALSLLGIGYQNTTPPDANGVFGPSTSGNLATPTNASNSSQSVPGLAQSLFINNVTPDNGLSPPFNSWLTFFGQFFDHGVDLITKGGSGTVFIPLAADDPLFVPGGNSNFMVLTRATNLPGPDGILGTADDIHQATNTITPFVDQSQTYASHASHQVFLRDYMIGADGKLHSSGTLLGHHTAGADGKLFTADDAVSGMATWGDVKLNAAKFLGIQLTDADVSDVPLLATDAYGNFIPGAHGLPQVVIKNPDGTNHLVEGNLANPISTANAVRVGVAFINDMAHSASPTDDFGVALKPQAIVAPGATPAAGFYDSKLLDAHYAAGDGRVNENIGLTAVQNVFHSEHNRLIAQTKAVIQAELAKGDTGFAADWVIPGTNLSGAARIIQDNEWNGERLFQVAKFGTETQYQHLLFGEFARFVSPAVHVFSGVKVHLDAAIMSEFANVVYRFGHSMLDENVNLYKIDPATGKPLIDPVTKQPVMTQMGLIQAFTNPLAFANDPNATADVVLGSVNQVGNEIDEFVTGTLRNNLLGLPLDLPALNIARGRDTGVAPLNLVRNQIYSQTGDSQLRPYTSWDDFVHFLKHPELLINFIAAYGTHASITAATTLADKRAAAAALVHQGTLGDPLFNPANLDAFNFMHSLGAYANNKLDVRAIHDSAGQPAGWSTGSVTGLDAVDLWIGGLAEKQDLFGGLLGSTFEFVFRTQLENLQDGDRLYYLPRVEGTHYADEIEASSFVQLIQENTGIKHLPGNIFQTPEYTIEASDYFQKNPDGSFKLDAAGNHIATTDTSKWLHNPQTGKLLVNVTADGTVQFLGDDNFLSNTIVLGGTEGDDKLTAGSAGGDTVWGDGGNDLITGGSNGNFLYGGAGDDTILGGAGADFIYGGIGNDNLFGGAGLDQIFGGDGNDYIDGGRGDDLLFGGLGNDILIGGEGNNTLVGGEGDDWLEAGPGKSLLIGDIGAPTGQVPLYGGNDVLISGVNGGTRMQGFSGDDIMLGRGSFDKFEGRLGFDWASYELATQGVDADLTRKEFITANGAVDSVRDVFIAVEGVSGSAFDDILKGTDQAKLLTTKDELSNISLINGLSGFFDPGIVLFDGGNIMLGGAGNDEIMGGGGNDIIDGDAFLHVGLTKHAAGGEIIRQILFDPNGNTWDPNLQTGNINPGNVDTAVYVDNIANYVIAAAGPDAEGFLTIQHLVGRPGAVGAVDDGTDRIRHIERLQFADTTVAIDANGLVLDPTVNDPHYDAVPVGRPVITETAAGPGGGAVNPATVVTDGNILTASVTGVTDADGIVSTVSLQWQVLDILRATWIPILGATGVTFTPTTFQNGQSIRVQATYTDGKGYKETVNSVGTALATLPGNVNTAPFIIPQQQLTGIPNTTGNQGLPIDFFVPFTAIFADDQTASNALIYTATLADGSSLASIGLTFTFDPVTGAGHFFGTPLNNFAGPLPIRVTATDNGPGVPLAVTNTFVIDVLPTSTPPVAINDSYAIVQNTALNIQTVKQGVLGNDTDPGGNTMSAVLVAGPANGTLNLNANGTFLYTPTLGFSGTDTFTYDAVDFAGTSNVATVTISVASHPVLAVALFADTGASATDRITSNPALVGSSDPNAAVFASIDGAVAVKIATANATGAWSFTPVLADGPHTVIVSEPNQPGNTSTASLTFTLDTVAPAAPGIGKFVSTAVATALTGYKVSGTAAAGSKVTLSDGGPAPLGTVIAAVDGSWSLAVIPKTTVNFSSNLKVTATDVAGNVSLGASIGLIVGSSADETGPTALATTGLLAGAPDQVLGLGGNDTILWGVGDGREVIDGGAGTDTARIVGDATKERFDIYSRAQAIKAGITGLDGLTQIAITRTSGGATAVISELRNVEEIVIAGNGGGDTFAVHGNLNGTGLAANTIRFEGSTGDDTVDISELTSAHRVVFASNGGHDTIIGTLRPQDVVELAPGLTIADYASKANVNGTTTLANGNDTVTFDTGVPPQFQLPQHNVAGTSLSFNYSFTDAAVEYRNGAAWLTGPDGTAIEVTGAATLSFTDGTIQENDGTPLVDDLFYFSKNLDVWKAHIDPDVHYAQYGWHEGRDPNAFFSTQGYLAANPDVAAAKVNPLVHYDQFGWQEGRDPSGDFSTKAYLSANPDVAAAGVDPLKQYLESGQVSGQSAIAAAAPGSEAFNFKFADAKVDTSNGHFLLTAPNGKITDVTGLGTLKFTDGTIQENDGTPLVDDLFYFAKNLDVWKAHIDPDVHYAQYGWHEGRDPNAFFSTQGYLAANPDVAAAKVNPLVHYDQFGWHEGRDPSAAFSTKGYLGANLDVAAAHVDPLQHYLQYGIAEGRAA